METLPNLKSRWHARRAAAAQNTTGTKTALVKDAGLALLDVLLGMAIFALIVVIAIQSVGQFRQRAFQTAAQSDAQQLSIGLESYFTDNQTYPANQAALIGLFSGTPLSSTTLGINLTKNTTITDYTANAADGDYSFCITHSSGGTVDAVAVYDSAKGAIVFSKRGGVTSGTNVATPTGGAGAAIDCV